MKPSAVCEEGVEHVAARLHLSAYILFRFSATSHESSTVFPNIVGVHVNERGF